MVDARCSTSKSHPVVPSSRLNKHIQCLTRPPSSTIKTLIGKKLKLCRSSVVHPFFGMSLIKRKVMRVVKFYFIIIFYFYLHTKRHLLFNALHYFLFLYIFCVNHSIKFIYFTFFFFFTPLMV